MSILWCGGEDVDFPNSPSGISVNTTAGNFRSGYARCALLTASQGAAFASTPFPGGGVTAAWLTFRTIYTSNYSQNCPYACGLGQSGSYNGLWVGLSAGNQVTLTAGSTLLATASAGISGLTKIDMQVSGFGTGSCTVAIYANGVQVLSYAGSITISGVTSFNQVVVSGWTNSDYGTNTTAYVSEVIVANESTLGFQGLVTCAPNGNGTTQQWSNPAYTNFNPTTINDANSTYVNVTGDDEQATLIAIPSGSFAIKAVKVIARASAPSGSTSTNIKLGFNNTNTSTVAVSSEVAVGTGFASVEEYFATDPTSSGGTGAWGANLTGYQLDMRSA